MTTKTYLIKLEGLGYFETYKQFKEKFKEKKKFTFNVEGPHFHDEDYMDYYDINNTAVILKSDNTFEDNTNLIITGLLKNIKQIEIEIKSEGFKLKRNDN